MYARHELGAKDTGNTDSILYSHGTDILAREQRAINKISKMYRMPTDEPGNKGRKFKDMICNLKQRSPLLSKYLKEVGEKIFLLLCPLTHAWYQEQYLAGSTHRRMCVGKVNSFSSLHFLF